MSNLAALLIISAGALNAGGAIPGTDDLKCLPRKDGPPELPEFIVMVDGEIVAVDPGQWDHKQYDIANTEIICWRWIEKQFGIQVRSGAVYVLTYSGIEAMKSTRQRSLEALVAAQDRHRHTHGTYAAHVEELGGYDPWRYLEFHLRLTEDGWATRVETRSAWGPFVPHALSRSVCYAFVGTPPADWKPAARREPSPRREEGPALVERTPACFTLS